MFRLFTGTLCMLVCLGFKFFRSETMVLFCCDLYLEFKPQLVYLKIALGTEQHTRVSMTVVDIGRYNIEH